MHSANSNVHKLDIRQATQNRKNQGYCGFLVNSAEETSILNFGRHLGSSQNIKSSFTIYVLHNAAVLYEI